jgi:hypothetical protein
LRAVSHTEFYRADYGAYDSSAFSVVAIQSILKFAIDDALAGAASDGMAVRTVDVVGHSMGGLVTRFFLSTNQASASPELPSNPVHRLITIGTPHLGSALAALLVQNVNQTQQGSDSLIKTTLCAQAPLCTLGAVFGLRGKTIGSGLQSMAGPDPLSPQLQMLSPTNEFSAIVGAEPSSGSPTESILNYLIGQFLPGLTVDNALGTPNDTIVAATSQEPIGTANITDNATICNVVHTAIDPGDIGETRSHAIWQQVLWWLLGGTGPISDTGCTTTLDTAASLRPRAAAAPSLLLDLTGYAQVPSTNVTFSPARTRCRRCCRNR